MPAALTPRVAGSGGNGLVVSKSPLQGIASGIERWVLI
jgi:hypothetical protein